MKADKDIIIYAGGFQLPNKNAAAQRVISNGKILRDLKYEVIYLGVNNKKNIEGISKIHDYNEFECWEEKYPQSKVEWVKYLASISNIKALVEQKDKNRIKAIVAYNYPAFSLISLKLYCKKNNIKLLSDCTEWYDAKIGNGIMSIIKWLDTELRMKYIHPKLDGIICISEYLRNEYKGKCNTVVIPPLVDLNDSKWAIGELELSDEIRIVYAGNPGINKRTYSKDRLDLIIKLLHKFKDKFNFKLQVLGLTEEDYLKAFQEHKTIIEELGKSIVFYGRTEHEKVIEIVKSASFVMFLRNDDRVSKAGFPTKFVEAMSAGTPVITNKSSDLEKYLINGENGFFIDINNEEKGFLQIEEILKMSKNEIIDMKKKCKDITVFDFRNYKEKLDSILQ